jgi:hypothetical protein
LSGDAKTALRVLLDVLADARIAHLARGCRSLGTRAPRELLNAMRNPDRANRPSAVQADEIAAYARALAEGIAGAAGELSSSVRILALSPATPTAVSSALPALFAVPPSAESPLMSMSVRDVDQLIASIEQQLAAARAAHEESAAAMQADGSNPRRAELRQEIAELEERRENALAARVVAQRHEAELRAEEERRRRREAFQVARQALADGLERTAELESAVGRVIELFMAVQECEDCVRSAVVPRLRGDAARLPINLDYMLAAELDRLKAFLRGADGPGRAYLGMTQRAVKWRDKQLFRIAQALGLPEGVAS